MLEEVSPTIPVNATRQAVAAQDRSAPGKVTGRLHTALMSMVWDGSKRGEAAIKAGMTEHSLYVALRRPHVKQFYLSELDVLRTSERARNIHALVEVRDQEENKMARVQAVKALEQISDEPSNSRGAVSQPGMLIIVNTVAQPAIVDVTPGALAHD